MPLRPLPLAAGLAAALLAALATLPMAVAQFRPDWSPWGGPDSPGGLFGGDPLSAEPHSDQPMHQDAVWAWMQGRFQAADRDRDGRVSMEEMRLSPGSGGGGTDPARQAWFRAADVNHDGHLSPEELKMFSGMVFRFHDTDGDGKLTRHEIRRQAPLPVTAGPAPGPGAPAATAGSAPSTGAPAGGGPARPGGAQR
jgi:hypothetical protein